MLRKERVVGGGGDNVIVTGLRGWLCEWRRTVEGAESKGTRGAWSMF